MSGWKLVNMFGVSVKITSSLVISIDFHFLGHWMSFPEEHKDKNCTPLSSSIIVNDILTRIFNFHTRNRMNRITSVDPATKYSSSTAMHEPLRNPIGLKIIPEASLRVSSSYVNFDQNITSRKVKTVFCLANLLRCEGTRWSLARLRCFRHKSVSSSDQRTF